MPEPKGLVCRLRPVAAAGPLRRLAVVELKQSAQPLGFGDRACFLRQPFIWKGDEIIETLVVPFPLERGQILLEHIGQRALAKQNQVVQTLAFDGADPALGIGI
jgi:hypothetical protein